MEKYNHKKIESKWQDEWQKSGAFKIDKKDTSKEKCYVLDMFPYPSGEGLHMGHTESYTASDVYSRFKKMQGFNVLHPQGFDAFGLPAENYAIKTGVHPAETTEKNINTYIEQMKMLGLAYDFDEQAVTSDPEYYKWTQWLFGQFYKEGLVYKKTDTVNWCPSCHTILANEQVVAGECERCGSKVEQKEIPSWFFKITDFADELIDDLDKVDWPEYTKKNQKNWIGKSEGAKISFKIKKSSQTHAERTQNYAENGREDILILHGWEDTSESGWIPETKKYLESLGHRVFAFDQPNTEEPKFEEWFNFIEDKIKENNLKDFSIIGHSMGGHLALKLSEKYKLNKLILISPVGFAPSEEYFNQFDENLDEEEISIFRNYQNRKLEISLVKENSKRIEFIFGKDDKWITKEIRDFYINNFSDVAKIQILEERGHLSEGEGVKKIQELENIFLRESATEILKEISVFTTRPDTLFGATYMVLAPEHELVAELKDKIENWDEVEKYVATSKNKSEMERIENKEKTGVKLEGISAINPANQEEIPVFIADYVLAGYGTGAIMAVPAHDERDFEFATKFGLPIKEVIHPVLTDTTHPPREDKEYVRRTNVNVILFNSKDKKYAFLKWNQDIGWKTTIGGGVRENESYENAGKREILEESGYKNVKFVKEVGGCIGKGFAKHKDINRISDVVCLYFELEDEEQQEVDEREKKQHEVVWLKKDEVSSFLNMPTSTYMWNLFNNENFVYAGTGEIICSEKFNGMNSEEAKKAITKEVGGKMATTYRLRDWSISRQRYWGCPIPIVYDPEGEAHLVPDEHLPWKLPADVDFVPTGISPLAKSEELKKRTEEIFGEGWTPEVDTMDTFVDSSWYFLRYPDPHNKGEFCSKDKLNYWLPPDLYIGGAEHTYMHLLFARFFVKAMNRIGLIDFDEPFPKLRHQGMVLDGEGKKMSKSKGNVINPNDMVDRFGADSVRTYMLFAAPLEDDVIWNEDNIVGVYRFLEKVWDQSDILAESTSEVKNALHKTIRKITNDIEELKYNTAVSEMMKFMNVVKKSAISKEDYELFLKLLAPFSPHITEELWGILGNKDSIHNEDWPKYDESLAKDDTHIVVLQVNGKVRGEIEIKDGVSEESVKEVALEQEVIKKWLNGEEPKRIIYITNKLVNIVV